MSTISASQPVPTVPSSVTASPGAVHEAQTLMPLTSEVLRCDADVQPRLALSEAHIRAYATLLQEGHALGTIVVFQDGRDYYLADGFHCVAAAKSIGLEELPAEIRVGTKREAMLYACGANKHGKPLSNPDKQRVVLHLLEDAEWGQWSDREIARHCGVGHALVSRLRRSLSPGDSDTAPRTYRTKQGTVTTMETHAIGKRAAPDVPVDTSKPQVSPPPAGTTHTAEGATDASPTEVVAPALQRHEGDRPTPALADALSQGTDRQATFPVTEGGVQAGLQEAEAVHAAFPTRLCQLLEPLQELATFPDLEQLLLDISPDGYDRVDHYLDTAFEILSRLKTLWKAHRDADACQLQGPQEQPSLGAAVSAEPQQPCQPAQAPRHGETGPAQPREETEDAMQQPAKTEADYDSTRFYLGKLCPRAHTYRDTGQTLRRKSKGDCVQCHRES